VGKPERAKLPKVLNDDSARALLQANGLAVAIGGKHSTKMVKPGQRPITQPRHQGKGYGANLRSDILRSDILRSDILRQAPRGNRGEG